MERLRNAVPILKYYSLRTTQTVTSQVTHVESGEVFLIREIRFALPSPGQCFQS